MSYQMTSKELKKIINAIPDDCEVRGSLHVIADTQDDDVLHADIDFSNSGSEAICFSLRGKQANPKLYEVDEVLADFFKTSRR